MCFQEHVEQEALDGSLEERLVQMNKKFERSNQNLREEMNLKLEQMNETNMMRLDQIMEVLSAKKDSDEKEEEIYRRQEETNQTRFQNLEN